MTIDAIHFPPPTSKIQSKRGKNMSIVYSSSIRTPYSPMLGCMLTCTNVDSGNEASYNSTVSTCAKEEPVSYTHPTLPTNREVSASILSPLLYRKHRSLSPMHSSYF